MEVKKATRQIKLKCDYEKLEVHSSWYVDEGNWLRAPGRQESSLEKAKHEHGRMQGKEL